MRESYEPIESGSLLPRDARGDGDSSSARWRSRASRLRVAIGIIGALVVLLLVAVALGRNEAGGTSVTRSRTALPIADAEMTALALDEEDASSEEPDPEGNTHQSKPSHSSTLLAEKIKGKDANRKSAAGKGNGAKTNGKVGRDARARASKDAGAGGGQQKLSHQNQAVTHAGRLTAKRALADPEGVCDHPDYSRTTLKLATESTMVALFSDLHGEKKFEASDVIPLNNDYLVVYDNLYLIGKIERSLSFRGAGNSLIHSSPKREGESGYEALVYVPERKTFLMVVESEEKKHDPFHGASIGLKKLDTDKEGDAAGRALDGTDEDENGDSDDGATFHAIIEEVRMPFLVDDPAAEAGHDDRQGVPGSKHHGYELHDRCPTEFTFASGNKGFEGAVHVIHRNEIVLLGLCEGNFCEGGKRGRKPGHGRLVLMVKEQRGDGPDAPCVWATVGVLALPATAAFHDYSAVAILHASGTGGSVGTDPHGEDVHGGKEYHLAVTSQESSQVWIGQLRTRGNYSDWSLTDGVVYNFPRDANCDVVFCNIEGISFVDDNLLVAVSDKMKSGGRQNYRCLAKDQSIHTFVLP